MAQARELSKIIEAIKSLIAIRQKVIVCIDGPAGAGKSTLAEVFSSTFDSVNVVHMDDLYEGWSNPLKPDFYQRIENQIVIPHLNDLVSEIHIYDWRLKEFAETKTLEPKQVLVLEGVGAAATDVRKFANLVVYIDIDPNIGLQRVLERDGVEISTEMQNWQNMEDAHFKIDKTKEAADFVVDGSLAMY